VNRISQELNGITMSDIQRIITVIMDITKEKWIPGLNSARKKGL
jgi:hypothetical protein